jgi:AcrR family transcriptional regulator
MASTKTPAPTETDGRTARAERTREAIADAVLSLLQEGILRPTGPQVAERAGVSLRSVFQHFEDMDALHATVAQRQTERILAQTRLIPRDGPLAARIQALAAERARFYESITPVRRAILLHEPFSPVVAERLQWSRERARDEIAAVFENELRALPTAIRREVLDALTAAGSWSAWESLRRHQQLSSSAARKVLQRMLASILNAALGSQ